MKKSILISYIVTLVSAVSLSSETIAQNKKKEKKKTRITTEYRQVTGDERRQQVEALLLEGKYQHDGSGELLYIGTVNSVPALLKVLQDNPPQIVSAESQRQFNETTTPPLPVKKIYVCTHAHAVMALHKITGQKFTDYSEWSEWWEKSLAEKERKNNL